MKFEAGTNYQKSKHVKPWIYITVLLINVSVFLCIGLVYNSYSEYYKQKLFDENVNNVESINTASANAAYTYADSMEIKINDIVHFIEINNLDYDEAVKYLVDSNTNPNRQFQLILSGSYGNTGELSFGDYSGISIRKYYTSDNNLGTSIQSIIYGSGYYDILRSFTDISDNHSEGTCFTPEFTDPDTKSKCFAAYRHIDLKNSSGRSYLYTLLFAVNSQAALDAYNMRIEYSGQSTVLINEEGDYIIKNSDYRNVNFYDYIVNYNGLALNMKTELFNTVRNTTADGKSSANLFYKNHKGDDCVFSISAIANGWYSITCVPVSIFNHTVDEINYSLIILLLFFGLFCIDGTAIYLIGKLMNYNISVAEQATATAVNANKAKSRFLSNISHELRTPLNAIVGLVSLSQDSIDNKAVITEYLGKIDVSSKLLIQLINDILDVSVIENNKMKLNYVEFNIAELIKSLSAIYYDQCAAKDIEFNTELTGIPSDTIIGDSVRVNQILLNFLSNAVKYTPAGGKITFRAESVKHDETFNIIKFTVSDTGCGISEELSTRLFKPFERSNDDKSRKYSGTGLGLSIAKSLTELMNGHIGMESSEGSGSHFWAEIPFEIPVHTTDNSSVPLVDTGTVSNTKDITQGFDFHGKRVLLVEDNKTNILIAKKLLQKVGFEVEIAENGKLGYEIFSASEPTHFDAVLMDIQMPVMDGYEAATKIRACEHPNAKNIPILAMTADAFSEDIERSFMVGMNEHLSKPIIPENFYATLQKYLCI